MRISRDGHGRSVAAAVSTGDGSVRTLSGVAASLRVSSACPYRPTPPPNALLRVSRGSGNTICRQLMRFGHAAEELSSRRELPCRARGQLRHPCGAGSHTILSAPQRRTASPGTLRCYNTMRPSAAIRSHRQRQIPQTSRDTSGVRTHGEAL